MTEHEEIHRNLEKALSLCDKGVFQSFERDSFDEYTLVYLVMFFKASKECLGINDKGMLFQIQQINITGK